ncbi:MAG: hypothetical protein GX347_01725 [Epulopiscium sp.]|nr:hypothetical protein [Candidatus Epulonipiscium sp.]
MNRVKDYEEVYKDTLQKQFLNPEAEYTPIPFWFWNDHLNEEEIIKQIHDFYNKGINGFVIHPRIGIPKEIPYLSDRFMELVVCSVQEAQKLNMKVVLYDEAMYPSGSAHGMVVQSNPEYASKGLKMIEYPCKAKEFKRILNQEEQKNCIAVVAVKKRSKKEIDPQYSMPIEIQENQIFFTLPDTGDWSIILFIETFTGGHIRGIHFGEDDGEVHRPPSSDLLNPKAIQEFIHLTHDRYYQVLGQYFGDTIIGMFTDEPSIMGRNSIQGLQPWTSDFLSFYQDQGNDITDLPILWFQAGEETIVKRKKFKQAIYKRLEQSYYRPISTWCKKHNIVLTGHPEDSDDIGVLKYFHIPAQDLVWRWVAPEDGKALEGKHSTMGKCSSDSARHRGRRRNGNECFACSGKNFIDWSFSMDDMKWYMDWLFVRGVNLLFPHAFFYSLRGERRYGERPPDVGPNNIWWPYYNQISDYIKRMGWLMTDSVNQTPIAILCEAYYLPWKIVKPLYQNQIEFNYLENEILTSSACHIKGDILEVAQQKYKVLVIEDIQSINKNNQFILQAMIDSGIHVVVYNPQNEKIPLIQYHPLKNIDEIIFLLDQLITRDSYLQPANYNLRISHIVKEKQHFYLLVNEGEEPIVSTLHLNIKGFIEVWDPWNGCIENNTNIRQGLKQNEIEIYLERRESKIIRVIPSVFIEKKEYKIDTKVLKSTEIIDFSSGWSMGMQKQKLQKIDSLKSWTQIQKVKEYVGTMFYQKELYLKNVNSFIRIQLDLGKVGEIAHLYVNNKEVGVKMWSPYNFDITDFIQEGKNTIFVEIKNSLANHFNKANIDSGMIGPVIIKIWEKDNIKIGGV